jgi:hypothetical protein
MNAESRRVKAVLVLFAGLMAAGAVQAQTLNWMEVPRYGTVDLNPGFDRDPRSVRVEAGGSTQMRPSFGRDCAGYVAADKPDVDINYGRGGNYNLYIYVESAVDTTLVVNLPSGDWVCNDDGGGSLGVDPLVIVRPAQAGNYNVWIGTYDDTNTVPAVLKISEVDPR